jgi:hypothetical protein
MAFFSNAKPAKDVFDFVRMIPDVYRSVIRQGATELRKVFQAESCGHKFAVSFNLYRGYAVLDVMSPEFQNIYSHPSYYALLALAPYDFRRKQRFQPLFGQPVSGTLRGAVRPPSHLLDGHGMLDTRFADLHG